MTNVEISSPVDIIKKISQLQKAQTLSMSRCGLRELPIIILYLPKLTSLDLSSNPIKTLDPIWEASLPHLHSLNLSACWLRSLPVGPPSFFSTLENLNLDGNFLGRLSSHPLVNFSVFPKLKTLSLVGNDFIEVPVLPNRLEKCIFRLNSFKSIPQANVSIFDASYCSLSSPLSIYSGLLTNLNLSHCGITGVLSLPQLPLLDTIDASNNQITDVKFESSRRITVFRLSNNGISRLPDYLFKLPMIRVIELAHNAIESIPNDLDNFKRLESIDLSHNQLITGRLKLPLHLQAIRLSFNFFVAFESFPPSLQYLDVSFCKVAIIPLIPPSLEWIAAYFVQRLIVSDKVRMRAITDDTKRHRKKRHRSSPSPPTPDKYIKIPKIPKKPKIIVNPNDEKSNSPDKTRNLEEESAQEKSENIKLTKNIEKVEKLNDLQNTEQVDSQAKLVYSGSEDYSEYYDDDYDSDKSKNGIADDHYSFIQERPILGDTSSIVMTKALMNDKLSDYIGCSATSGRSTKYEDNFMSTVWGDISFVGVFDGHVGHEAAFISAEAFANLIGRFIGPSFNESPSVLKAAVRRTFALVNDELRRRDVKDGTTAVVVGVNNKTGRVCVGHLGDSLALMVCKDREEWLTKPHRPMDKLEYNRMRAEQKSVSIDWRVDGKLCVSRSLGDFWCCDGMYEEPDVKIKNLPSDIMSIVLGCDGIWDYIDSGVACNVVRSIRDPVRASRLLQDYAFASGSHDNISVIVMNFPTNNSIDANDNNNNDNSKK
ncbi:hypothetical protein M9Y10_033392 [Tritrichomonas musculus]|uniref:PPM-type phosphatase domain-containing protein n=1 Tax=Tritrichomonas musculus TaxID=1915356 RepID=A0ABR2KC22_9EUKA